MNWYKQAQQEIQVSRSKVKSFLASNNFDGLSGYLYECITRNFSGVQEAQKKLADPKFNLLRDKYNSIVSTAKPSNNPGWAQWDIQKSLQQTSGDMKLYFSPLNNDVEKFINGLQNLYQILVPISTKYNCNIDFKIPTTLSSYLGLNDKLIVHFSNQQATREINQIISNWGKSYGITFGQRTHSIGQDIGGKSYGERISEQISNYSKQYLESKKYNVDQITDWVLLYFNKLLTNVGGS